MSKKVILADDNRTFLMYVGLLLKRFDFKVMPAEDGMEVIRLLKLAEADLVMLDIFMKGMDGISVLRHIKEDKLTSHIPVIMVSVNDDPEMIEKCRALGCFGYLTKPVKIDKLYGMLQRCFFTHQRTNRNYLRAVFTRKVTLMCDGKPYDLFTETLSERGIYVRKDEPFPEGSEVEVSIPLPSATIRVRGTVIYTRKLFNDLFTLPPGMAIQFTDLSPEDAEALKYHIEDIMAKDIIEGQEEKVIER